MYLILCHPESIFKFDTLCLVIYICSFRNEIHNGATQGVQKTADSKWAIILAASKKFN